MKNIFIFLFFIAITVTVQSQSGTEIKDNNYTSYIDYQQTLPRPAEAMRRKLDTLQKQFVAKKLKWPAKYIYIRSFKYDSELEVWVRNSLDEPFLLFKKYRVCALAGTLGPKRMEGDYQVPEGFYFVNELKPNSDFYLSLGINYPNASDRILSDAQRPGSAIYIHGSCVTVGCIPLTDEKIDELYLLAAYAKSQGQDFIPVHVFPIRYNVSQSVDYLEGLTKSDDKLKKFVDRLKQAFDFFENTKELPIILTNENGEYIVYAATPKKKQELSKSVSTAIKEQKPPIQHRIREIKDIANFVHEAAEYIGGNSAWDDYIKNVGEKMSEFLPDKIDKMYLQVEFIIDTDGAGTNFKIVKGSDDYEFNDILINMLEKMKPWKPAILGGKPVAKKMITGITVERKKAA